MLHTRFERRNTKKGRRRRKNRKSRKNQRPRHAEIISIVMWMCVVIGEREKQALDGSLELVKAEEAIRVNTLFDGCFLSFPSFYLFTKRLNKTIGSVLDNAPRTIKCILNFSLARKNLKNIWPCHGWPQWFSRIFRLNVVFPFSFWGCVDDVTAAVLSIGGDVLHPLLHTCTKL